MANGDHDWVAAEVVTAANMDDYLQLQTVQKFATAAARDAALTTRKREGMLTYQDDTNSLTSYSGAAWSTIGPVSGAPTSFDPVITQSGAVTHTVNSSVYWRMGRSIVWKFLLTMTGAGSAANLVTLSLPVNVAAGGISDMAEGGPFNIYDTSANAMFVGGSVAATASTIKGWAKAALAPTFFGTSSFTAALASGDIISGYFIYEAAADA